MLEGLTTTLEQYGLSLNVKKTMIISTEDPPEVDTFCETNSGFVQILHGTGLHKYLGRCFCGDLRHRAGSALEHRLGCAWAKFRDLEKTLTNHHVGIRLRLRLFDAVVSPTVLYGLETAPLTSALLTRLDTTQRCMLRRMLGWVCFDEDTYEERGRRMKLRLQRALALHPVKEWSAQWAQRKQKLKDNMTLAPPWTRASYEWSPQTCGTHNNHIPYRKAGRPRTQW